MRKPDGIVTAGYYQGLRRKAARATLILASVAVLGIITVVVALSRGYWANARYNSGFGSVSVGDSRPRVVELMGGSGRERDCVQRGEDRLRPCVVSVSYVVEPRPEWSLAADLGVRRTIWSVTGKHG